MQPSDTLTALKRGFSMRKAKDSSINTHTPKFIPHLTKQDHQNITYLKEALLKFIGAARDVNNYLNKPARLTFLHDSSDNKLQLAIAELHDQLSDRADPISQSKLNNLADIIYQRLLLKSDQKFFKQILNIKDVAPLLNPEILNSLSSVKKQEVYDLLLNLLKVIYTPVVCTTEAMELANSATRKLLLLKEKYLQLKDVLNGSTIEYMLGNSFPRADLRVIHGVISTTLSSVIDKISLTGVQAHDEGVNKLVAALSMLTTEETKNLYVELGILLNAVITSVEQALITAQETLDHQSVPNFVHIGAPLSTLHVAGTEIARLFKALESKALENSREVAPNFTQNHSATERVSQKIPKAGFPVFVMAF